MLGPMVGPLLDLRERAKTRSPRVFHGWAPSSHPVVGRALSLRGDEPKLDGQALGQRLGQSPSRLLCVFQGEVGVSLVEYRSRLRLDRFFAAVDQDGSHLLEAALAAGFGSYSQLRRLFRELVGTTPREYLLGPGSSRARKRRRSPGSL